MSDVELKVNHVYRAKRPAASGGIFNQLVNDRQILWMGLEEVQYDSPTVPFGSHYRRVTKIQFLRWAGEDVTMEMPADGSWAPWPLVK